VTAPGIGYAAAVVLAAVFAVAAIGKLRDPEGTAADFDALGVPRPRTMALFVPLAELSVAALLLIVPAAGALGALVTLAFFTAFLVGRVRAGVRAPCACFGSNRRDPLSWVQIVRNVGLGALAAVALATDRPQRSSPADIAVVLALVAAAALGLRLARHRAGSATPPPHPGSGESTPNR
jgi:uncharacterized membrane protein YphA (DoxX/SURF4 family)